MPIRPELRHLYRGPGWRAARRRILERAGGRFDAADQYLGGACCEQCGKPHLTIVYVYSVELPGQDRMQAWVLPGMSSWTDSCGQPVPIGLWPCEGLPRRIRCVLTVAHLNHQAGDDRDDNLRALCQWCHLHHDQPYHRYNIAGRKDRARPILELSLQLSLGGNRRLRASRARQTRRP